MLFHRFSWVILFVALVGIGVAQLVGTVHRAESQITAGERLKEWRVQQTDKACKSDPEICAVVMANMNTA